MRRGAFILIFVLLALGFFYSPIQRNDLIYNGPSCGGAQATQGCGGPVEEQNSQGQCLLVEGVDEISGKVPKEVANIDLSANYFYEGYPTSSWKFRVQGDNLKMVFPQLNPLAIRQSSKVFSLEIQPGLSPLSTENCKVYSFLYKRAGGSTLTYEVPLDRVESFNGVNECVYSANQIISDLWQLGISALIDSIDGICPELNGRELPQGASCNDVQYRTAECPVAFPLGEESYYLAFFENDKCGGSGNRIISEGESGRAFTKQEYDSGVMSEIARNWVEQCELKYEESLCGNGVIDEGEECDFPYVKMDNGLIKELPLRCDEYSDEYSGGFLACPGTCMLDTRECEKTVSGYLQLDVASDALNSDGGVLKRNIYAKTIAQFNVDRAKENGDFNQLRYVLKNEGANSFEGVYSASLETLARGAPKTWNLLTVRGRNGIYGEGVVYSVYDDDSLKVEQIYSRDLSIHNLLEEHDEDDHWKTSELGITLTKKQNGNYDALVYQQIRDFDEGILLADRSTRVELTANEARDLMVELLFRFKSWETKTQGTMELNPRRDGSVNNSPIPVIDMDDVVDKINSHQFESGVRLKQYKKFIVGNIFINKRYTYTTIDIQKIINYLSSLQNLLGYENSFVEPNFNFNPGEFA